MKRSEMVVMAIMFVAVAVILMQSAAMDKQLRADIDVLSAELSTVRAGLQQVAQVADDIHSVQAAQIEDLSAWRDVTVKTLQIRNARLTAIEEGKR